VGGSSEVCQLMLPHWRKTEPAITLQFRQESMQHLDFPTVLWQVNDRYDALDQWICSQAAPPKTMIVLAGATHHRGTNFDINTKIAEHCCKAAAALGIHRILLASSAAVYGNHLNRAFSEADTPRPTSQYGMAKLNMELTCQRWSGKLEIVCLRIGNVVGADALLAKRALRDKSELLIDCFNDGSTPERSYIGPKSMATALVELAELNTQLPPILNFAAPAPVQMGDLATAANVKWRKKSRTDSVGKSITMDSSRLWDLLPSIRCTSDPKEMVEEID
jgi:UDP-glucose 4-epimerase